jgi:hypothetical protein
MTPDITNHRYVSVQPREPAKIVTPKVISLQPLSTRKNEGNQYEPKHTLQKDTSQFIKGQESRKY